MLKMFDVKLTKHKMPEPHQLVIVKGGMACWTGSTWISKVGDDNGRVITWDVRWWMPVIQDCLPEDRQDFGRAVSLECVACGEVSTNPGQFIQYGEFRNAWVCSAACRRDLAEKQSYDDLAASGGIVDAP